MITSETWALIRRLVSESIGSSAGVARPLPGPTAWTRPGKHLPLLPGIENSELFGVQRAEQAVTAVDILGSQTVPRPLRKYQAVPALPKKPVASRTPAALSSISWTSATLQIACASAAKKDFATPGPHSGGPNSHSGWTSAGNALRWPW